MEDRDLAAAMVVGDAWARADAYDSYADRLYSYCLSLIGDHDAAADALHDTFIIANEHVGQLRRPERLRAWLYAIARTESRRPRPTARGRRTARETDESLEALERSLRRVELSTLAWHGSEGLDPLDREILDLSARHGLPGPELAAVLGVADEAVPGLLASAWQEMERTLTVMDVVAEGRGDCRRLRRIVRGRSQDRLPLEVRRHAERHIERCRRCEAHLPEAVGSSGLEWMLPMVVAPRALRPVILGHSGARRLARRHQQVARRARFDDEGFPLPAGRRRSTVAWRRSAAVLIPGALLLATAPLWRLPGPAGAEDRPGQAPRPEVSAWSLPRGAHPSEGATPQPGTGARESPAPEMWLWIRGPGGPAEQVRSPAPAPTALSFGGARAAPREGQAPATSPTPTPSSAPRAGELVVTPTYRDVGHGSQTTVTLAASGRAPVRWSAAVSQDFLAVSPASGTLRPGSERTVTITVDRTRAPADPWRAYVMFRPGDQVVTVTGEGTPASEPAQTPSGEPAA
ncbi:MAG: sigma factor [Carbonactinosporaceae bacterium]